MTDETGLGLGEPEHAAAVAGSGLSTARFKLPPGVEDIAFGFTTPRTTRAFKGNVASHATGPRRVQLKFVITNGDKVAGTATTAPVLVDESSTVAWDAAIRVPSKEVKPGVTGLRITVVANPTEPLEVSQPTPSPESPSIESEEPVRITAAVTQPVLKRRVQPYYPRQSREDHIEGVVILEAVIDKHEAGHTVRMLVSIDGAVFTSYAADGMIIATPEGPASSWRGARLPPLKTRAREAWAQVSKELLEALLSARTSLRRQDAA